MDVRSLGFRTDLALLAARRQRRRGPRRPTSWCGRPTTRRSTGATSCCCSAPPRRTPSTVARPDRARVPRRQAPRPRDRRRPTAGGRTCAALRRRPAVESRRRGRDDGDVGAPATAAEHRRRGPAARERRRLGAAASRCRWRGERRAATTRHVRRRPQHGVPPAHPRPGTAAGTARSSAAELIASLGIFTAAAGLARFQSVKTHPDHRGQGLAGTLVHARRPLRLRRAGRAARW